MGVKLFAWIGGLALFIGVALFLKYSFEHNLIVPEMRAAMGFVTGIGLLITGLRLSRKRYAVMTQTLCGTGILILYAVTFACRAIYHFEFFGLIPTFLLMALITTTAFFLAVRLNALVIATLGMLGGFLTPVLLSTGHDNPLGLFGYIALLDVGLIAVALYRRWDFLPFTAAIGTACMQLGWANKFFDVPNVYKALGIFVTFNILFAAACYLAQRMKRLNDWFPAASLTIAAVTFGFTFYLQTFATLGNQPWIVFAFVLAADLAVCAVVLLREKLLLANMLAGMLAFLSLATWTLRYLNGSLLNWALGLYFVFALLHSVFPMFLRRIRPGISTTWWPHLFPPMALLLVMAPIVTTPDVSFVVWLFVLVVDLLAIGVAILSASVFSIIAVLILTLVATGLWILKVPGELTDLPMSLFLIGGFATFFFTIGMLGARKFVANILPEEVKERRFGFFGNVTSADTMAQIPALSAIFPFLLLIMVTMKLHLTNPLPIFGLAMLLIVLLLGAAQRFQQHWLSMVGLICVLALEHAWHFRHFTPENALLPLLWYLGFTAVFTIYPFAFRKHLTEKIVPWASAALAAPLHFYLVQRLVKVAYPNNFMGILPALFAIPLLIGLVVLIRRMPAAIATKNAQLAWFGAAVLFFVTLIFPIQFNRQWITIGWALEGAALLWLFHRIPHRGLRFAGTGLLVVSFLRLAVNPAVLEYYVRSETPILNWYLYSYGLVAAALFAGARFLNAPRDDEFARKVRPMLYGLGTALLFLLVNIEIADYFSTGTRLRFEFSGNFGRDMTYTIAWALFAFVMLVIGIAKQLRAARYAGLALLSISLLKLFFHDLAHLKQLYRIGALISVAVIAMLASFIYQRFLSRHQPIDEPNEPSSAS